MKRAIGVVWKYRNSGERGMTWAAELRVGNALLCVYGQKLARSAIVLANEYASALGWEMKTPWDNITDKKLIRSMVSAKRRDIRHAGR